jgi:hypothetical protein
VGSIDLGKNVPFQHEGGLTDGGSQLDLLSFGMEISTGMWVRLLLTKWITL